MRVEVFPLEKITIDNKEIMLGMNIDEVQKLIGIPDRVFSNCDGESGRHYYFDSELGLDFDESGLLEFIEFLGGIDGNLRPYLYGVSAFETSADELLHAVRKVAAGELAIEQEVSKKVEYHRNHMELHEDLTARERDVLQLIAKGYENQRIADELFISLKTVKTHVSNILAKLEVSDRTQAAVYAFQHHLVGQEDF